MRYEKTWREIIPQMIQAAYEDAERRFRRSRNPHGMAFCYFKGVSPEIFSGLKRIMFESRVYYSGNNEFDTKTTYKVVISVNCKDNRLMSKLWYFEPVTE